MAIEPTFFAQIVSWVGTAIGIWLNVTPGILFLNIALGKEDYKKVPELMILNNILCSLLWLVYWIRLGIFTPIFSSSIGEGLSIIFGVIYLYYYCGKKYGMWLFGIFLEFGLVFGVFFVCRYLIKDDYVVGTIATIDNIFNCIAPGQNILKAYRQMDRSYIPIWTTLSGAACGACWFFYGLLIQDWPTIINNGIGLIFPVINSAMWIYIKCNEPEKEDEAKQKLNAKDEKDEVEVETTKGGRHGKDDKKEEKLDVKNNKNENENEEEEENEEENEEIEN